MARGLNPQQLEDTLRELAHIEAVLKERGVPIPKPPAQKRTIAAADRRLSPLAWAYRYRRIDGHAFSLERHLPLKQVYDDTHPHLVVMKCAQVGASEMAVTRTLHALDVGAFYWNTGKPGLNVAYLFPTGKALSDFSKERLSSTLGEHRHIAEMFANGFDDITFKQAGASYLYLRSAYIPAGGKKNTAAEQLLSFPADVLILDEFDRMSPAAVSMIEKRLRASVVGLQCNISTPTLPGMGIHGLYLLSDRQVWEVPCDCGAWVEMDFFRDVVGKAPEGEGLNTEAGWQHYSAWRQWSRDTIGRASWAVMCPECQGFINRFAPGRWIARRPEITDIRGYHLPALAFPAVRLRGLAKAAVATDPTQIEEFYRSDLGLPFEAAGSKITGAMMNALPAPTEAPPRTGVTLGVDVGTVFHYRLTAGPLGGRGARTVVRMGSVASWDALDELFDLHPITRCVIDAQPELNATNQFADRHKGKVLRAYYTTDRTQKGKLFRVDEDKGVVYISRTMAMDAVFARVAEGADFWPRPIAQDPEVRAHMSAPSRTSVKDAKTGDVLAEWVHTAPDHFFHASLYDMIASLIRVAAHPGAILQGKARGWQP